MGKEAGKKYISKSIIPFMVSSVAILVGIIITGVSLYRASNSTNPIPKNIRQMVNFPVYYPDAKKMPLDYTLDTQSFSATDQGVVVYSIMYKGIKKIAVSEQHTPPKEDIEYFYVHDLPLHTTLNTPAGVATIGAIGQQAIASLPTNKNTWLLITAPANIDKTQFTQFLGSITQPNN